MNGMSVGNTPVTNNANEKLDEAIKHFMVVYDILPIMDQIDFFNKLKATIIEHRCGMINDSKSDLDMMTQRHEELLKGLEILKSC